MASFIARSLAQPLRRVAATSSFQTRAFSNKTIPSIVDHAVGRQKYELDAEAEGLVAFNRDPIETDETMGNSKEDPILVPSFESSRAVGISHNDSSYVMWFTLKKGHVHHVPMFGKYFLLFNPDELAALVEEIESKQEELEE